MGGRAGTAGPRARGTKTAASEARRAAARENGKKGGRPRKHKYDQIFADLAEPPTGDPLETCLWAQSISARALFETVQGRGNRELNAEIRAFTGVIIRAVPTERLAEVEKRIAIAAKARRTPMPAIGPPVESVTPGNPRTGGGAPIRG